MQRWSTGAQRGVARGIATLLFVLQAGAGGAVALAHASDSLAGPASLESHHSARCVTLHDAARCAQCQYDGTRAAPAAKRRVPLASGATHHQPNRDPARIAPARPRLRAAPPRAPPPSPA
ncbi:MAG TPA: hypothetical protein VIV56_09130 [Gemmatimonadales bacterium]